MRAQIDQAFPPRGLAKKAIGKLLTDGLVEEVPAGFLLPVWRRDDDRGPLALCITPRDLAAIGVEKAGALPEAPLLSGRRTSSDTDGRGCPGHQRFWPRCDGADG